VETVDYLDSKGRLTIPKKLREALNIKRKVLVINAGDYLKVVPLPPDPFEVLEGALDLKKPFKELRRQAELLAEREAREARAFSALIDSSARLGLHAE
jgi:AbrB family looped-hinge helix DNA binding protein